MEILETNTFLTQLADEQINAILSNTIKSKNDAPQIPADQITNKTNAILKELPAQEKENNIPRKPAKKKNNRNKNSDLENKAQQSKDKLEHSCVRCKREYHKFMIECGESKNWLRYECADWLQYMLKKK